ncbi:general transcription factor IIF subunit 2-like [Elysia marginata]|uniref:General transcription factor IIF subunit 2 n=1 Tax=Elysia marginata TaxID=1093978 RepID=A0AAV4G785_9GAST|nr:general transcription factor IIF subunit 2-like [Elysia marginata]
MWMYRLLAEVFGLLRFQSMCPNSGKRALLEQMWEGLKSQNQNTNSSDPLSEKLCVEGKVMQRAECHPIVDSNYRLMKKEQMQAHNTPQRQMKNEDKKSKKTEKRSRAEKDKVMDILFNAFEKHQFYNIKDLMGITKQPVPYLKEILKEICNYNVTAPHKHMWELKPEFRHYKTSEDAGS